MSDVSLAEGSDELDFSEVHVVEVDGKRCAFRADADHQGLAAGFSGVDARLRRVRVCLRLRR